MPAKKTMAQRLGQALETMTRQCGQLPETPAYGSWLLGRVSESPSRRWVRIKRIVTVYIMTANLTGIVVALLVVTFAFPVPSIYTDAPWWVTFGVAPAYATLALAIGTYWITTRIVRASIRWAIEERAPSQADGRNTLLLPFRVAAVHLILWDIGGALLATLYGLANRVFVTIILFSVTICGVLVATNCYLFTEFALRPVAAKALEAGRPPRRFAPGIMGRTMTVWSLGSGVPVTGIATTALYVLLVHNLTETQLASAVLILSITTLIFGFLVMWILAWLTAAPVRVVRAALKRVEQGDLRGDLVVFDGTELGELQRGFNAMVNGLRERERVRDLFGRHVGREVAAAAERERPQLGGTICGVLVATNCYLFTEFALRPVAAKALEAGRPPRRFAPGIMGRTMTVWSLGSGVPVTGIATTALYVLLVHNLTETQLASAVLILSITTLIFGFLVMWILAWLTAAPVRVVRAALKRVEQGDLRGDLVVFDGTELGELQRGFNAMVNGLRERERVRDLFGRHVGREVAAAAERERPQLGGEDRHAAVVFVDIVGSTQLVDNQPAAHVVKLLNRFFAIVVNEVDRHHGLINKFAGDAALAIFGAPNRLDRPEDAALAAARAIAERLANEMPEVQAGIGVAAGQIVAGNVGAKQRFEYTVVGKPVNQAARLCELAKSHPARLLASSDTLHAASET
ncbi:adenylate/guanylate cyclase domain-containing protein, partial [Mycobacterium tuberculosis]|uniref:adenylate/guanylate cyclase domain-containing protein n=1 Tax=Mycobacterium tuberculosis TaxID=1773 RepID=UPI001F420E0A